MHVTTGGSDNHMHPETNPVGIRTRSVTISLSAVSEAPTREDLLFRALCTGASDTALRLIVLNGVFITR